MNSKETEISEQDLYIAELEERIKCMKGTMIELGKRVVYTDKEKDKYWKFECECGFSGLTLFADGGGQIADTGDYGDCYCPCCWNTIG